MFPVEGQKLNFWNWTLSITKGLKTISAYVLECIFDMLKDILPTLQIVTAASCPIVQWGLLDFRCPYLHWVNIKEINNNCHDA